MPTSRPRLHLCLTALLLLGSVASCGGEPTGESRNRLQDSLVAERRRWRAQNIKTYTYQLQVHCTCATPGDPVLVAVRNDTVASITRVADGLQLAAAQYPMIRSVEGLFDLIQQAIDDKAATIFARFDPAMHYPTEIQIDWKTNETDDEVSYVAGSLEATP
ncbi:MAG: hypothetical protein IRZ00_13810 [Gemmatimonadetes bacterium]|nr:hypothetical protein [Gemmatimonadota bacterium]